jgi:UDP-N-acetylmuramoylalanine--D-glutamate ligase
VARVLVHGLAVTGTSTVRALLARGDEVVVTDDTVDDARRQVAADLGVELHETPADVGSLVRSCDLVSPAPGVPETHRVVTEAKAADVELVSEIELAYRWERERPGGPRPMLAVTGTDGKTTTTLMAAAMLEVAGVRTVAAGNTDVPLVDALEMDLDVYVVECTSFRLAWTRHFRAEAAVWLNLAPDHLNWHASMATYEAAKARIFHGQRTDDVAIGYAPDPVVMRHLAAARGRRVTFALDGADYHLAGDALIGPAGPIAQRSAMRRALPHDVTNALAAAAMVLETGLVRPDHVADALAAFAGPPHRIELVGHRRDGVAFYDDSKATTPHAASVAVRGFDRVVLIAGGRNKGLDLAPMAAEAAHVRAVVAIGEAAPDVESVFAPHVPVVAATSMGDAVRAADAVAQPGDVVLLSPGCASFDWYPTGGYPARGADFRRHVEALLGTGPTSDARDRDDHRHHHRQDDRQTSYDGGATTP